MQSFPHLITDIKERVKNSKLKNALKVANTKI